MKHILLFLGQRLIADYNIARQCGRKVDITVLVYPIIGRGDLRVAICCLVVGEELERFGVQFAVDFS